MQMFRSLLAIIVLFSAVSYAAAAEKSMPHVVIILVDDMGYGDLGCYNSNSKISTPYIDSLAREGLRFTDAHATGPLCHVSRYGLLTGRYPFRTNVSVWPRKAVIDPDRTTIASLLKAKGYYTAMVGKWHLGFNENGYDKPLPGGPVDVGFDSYFGIRASTDIPPYFYIRNDRAVAPPSNQIAANDSEGWSPIQGAFWRKGGIAPGLELKDVLPRFTDEAIAVINQHAKTRSAQPMMLYLAYPAPHTPWLPSEEFIGSSRASMYGDFTVMVDHMIGRVLKALERNGMKDDTLVIFSSDNGPVWYEGDVRRFDHDSSGGLRGMKGDAWEAGHRMPFIVRWPGTVKPASVTQQTICFTDVLATLAAITNTELKENEGPDSFNLLPVLKGQQSEDQPIRGPIVMRSAKRLMMVRSGPWKLIEGRGSGGFSDNDKKRDPFLKPDDGNANRTDDGAEGQLYHLGRDLGETKNLYSDHPEIVTRLKAELKQITESSQTR